MQFCGCDGGIIPLLCVLLHTWPRGVVLSRTISSWLHSLSFPFLSFHAPLSICCFQLSELPAWPHPLSPKLRDVMWEETVVCDVLLLWNYKQGEIIYASIGQTLVSINTRKYAHSIGLKYCVGIWFTNYRLFFQSAWTPQWKPEIWLAYNRWWKWWWFMADPLPTSCAHNMAGCPVPCVSCMVGRLERRGQKKQ